MSKVIQISSLISKGASRPDHLIGKQVREPGSLGKETVQKACKH